MEEDDFPPPGYRFFPTEEELVSFYLKHKLEGRYQEHIDVVIPVLNIYDHDPWSLPQFAGKYNRSDPEQWFFFIPMQEREARGGRPTRLTAGGYWKATGSPGLVYSSGNNRVIGGKRTMVFYTGRAPNGRKTEWKMNEYRFSEREPSNSPQEFILCRVYKKPKCARAFDRRPACMAPAPPAAGGGEPALQPPPPPMAAAANDASASTSLQKAEADKKSSSQETTSSPSPPHGGDRVDDGPVWDFSDEILWEWDPFKDTNIWQNL